MTNLVTVLLMLADLTLAYTTAVTRINSIVGKARAEGRDVTDDEVTLARDSRKEAADIFQTL